MNLAQAYLNVSLKLPIDDIKVKQRLDRGYDIINGYGYSISQINRPNPNMEVCYKVSKASTSMLEDNSAVYHVSITSCTCPDFEKARAGLCKHRLAVMLIEEMNKG